MNVYCAICATIVSSSCFFSVALERTGLKRVLKYYESLRVVKKQHFQAHDGRDRMIAHLGGMYVIQNLREKCGDIRQSGCPTCAAGDPSTTVAPMQPILSFAPGERLVVDMKAMPVEDVDTGHKWILNVIDHFSKFLWAATFPTKEAPAIAEFLREVITEVQTLHRVRVVHTDNGTEFVNSEFRAVIEEAGASAVTGRAYHPESQGVVERKNRTVADKVKKKAADAQQPDRWQRFVAEVVFNENSITAEREKLIRYIKAYVKKHGTIPSTSLEFYKFIKLLGKGAFGKITLGIHKLTGKYVAIKSIDKANIKDEYSRRKVF